ncbi:MAG: hypothetical protein NWF00_09175 [Candidatus Bathyarchaeota archaeon]|nr:hypothetical protein [Candidatus Bathyarchaeota archaeon]
MFATDVLKVIYQPQKAFKKIVQNPKYWGPILVLLIFIGAQAALFYSQYSKTYYEETSPTLSELTTWTDTPSLWTATSGVSVSSNFDNILNETFYGNSSLEFAVENSNSLTMTLNDFNGSVNCDPTGYQDLFMQAELAAPATAPSSVTLKLFSSDASNYFQTDVTSMFSNVTESTWSNYTIPVGSGDWQTSGNPDWSDITGLSLELVFPQNSDVTLRIGGLFFRGLYETPIEVLGAGAFIASAVFSAVTQFFIQWLALSIVFFLIIKFFKGAVTWKPLFISIAFALITMAVETFLFVAATASLPAQIYYPFEFSYSFMLSYSEPIVTLFSAASQATYNSVIASQVATYVSIVTFVAVASYVWLTAIGAAMIRALVEEFTWTKSLAASALSVIITFVVLNLLTSLGIL